MSLKLNYNITEWPKLGVNYFGIPKVGNTSMKYAFLEIENPNFVPDIDDPTAANAPIHNESISLYIDKKRAMTNGYKNFGIVRDPYDRFMSLYKDFMIKRPGMLGVSNMSLEEFSDWVLTQPDDLTTNVHVRSQYWFVHEGKKRICENLVVLNKDKIEGMMKTLTGVDISYPHIHTSMDSEVVWNTRARNNVRSRYSKDILLYEEIATLV